MTKRRNFKKVFPEAIITIAVCSFGLTAMDGFASKPYWYLVIMVLSLLAYLYCNLFTERQSSVKFIILASLALFSYSVLFALDKIVHFPFVWCIVIDVVATTLLLAIPFYKLYKTTKQKKGI